MRGFLHLAGTLVLVPYVILAAFFLLVGRAAASGSWWDFIDFLANTAYWTLRLGIPLAIAGFLALGVAGFFPAAQRFATMVLAGFSGVVLLILVLWPREWPDAGQLLFLLPCLVVFCGSVATLSSPP